MQRDIPIHEDVKAMLRQLEPIPAKEPIQAGTLTTRRLSDISPEPVSWLWPGRIARGKVTMIAGNPGLGKSQITASIAAIVTTGGCWPVDRLQCEPGDVLFLTAEDDPADTLRPRLEAAGADLTRVHVIDGVARGYTGDGNTKTRTFSLEQDLPALETKLAELANVAAVVIDPIAAYLGNVDSHKNAEVRGLMTPLSELASRHKAAIIGVSHLSKAAGAQALMRVNGSLAFVAAARAAYLVTTDPEDKARRVMVPMKNNLGPDSTGLAFFIESATVPSPAGLLETSRVAWASEPVHMTADEAMEAETERKSTSALDEAADWLREILSARPVAVEELNGMAKAKGISDKTLQRARKALDIRAAKGGMEGGWMVSLPPKAAKPVEDGQEKNLAAFEQVGRLRESQEVEVEV